jgi:hypothetical protein
MKRYRKRVARHKRRRTYGENICTENNEKELKSQQRVSQAEKKLR